MSLLHIIYASTSGHTEYVVETLAAFLQKQGIGVELQRAERAQPADLTKGDALLLACGTWNTGGVEGQMNPHMDAFLHDRAKGADLAGKSTALIALGDSRYYYTARATEHLMRFQRDHHGTSLLTPFVLVDEPEGQEEKIFAWGKKLAEALKKVSST